MDLRRHPGTVRALREKFILGGLFFAALLSFARPAGAVITFKAENNVLFSSLTAHSVVQFPGGLYRMYLTSDSFRVLSATSTNQTAWFLETGVRLSTSPSADIDSSSITAVAVYPSSSGAAGYRMFYTAISSQGLYSLLSATSTDGLAWGKETGIRLQNNSGAGFLDSPSPLHVSNSLLHLFYIADSTGGNSPANYRVHLASSNDGGLTFTVDSKPQSSEKAFQVSVTTLTDGRTRYYYTRPLSGETTSSQLLSAISAANNGVTFTAESGTRFSTSSAQSGLTYPIVVRATNTFQWRVFHSLAPSNSTGSYVSSALAKDPVVLTMDPATILNSASDIGFTLTGEIFAAAPAVTFTIGSDTIAATGVAASNDLNLTGRLNPLDKTLAFWNAVVVNPDGGAGTLSRAFLMDTPPGEVSVIDNLFRPLKGGAAQISAEVFSPGRMTIRLYTMTGGLVATLLDREVAKGTQVVNWNGTTALGSTVASGVYILSVQGPKLNIVKKIVVIK